jgi:S-adenosylmethionine-diacylglycerol 3-amino-3-carboxypropyl transferase
METGLPSWVADAARLPLAFAQVREDPLLDLRLVERLGRGCRVLLIASGGCTAALLAASGLPALIHLIDPNPAQLALSRLKLWLLQHAEPAVRLEVLGHAFLSLHDRRAMLATALSAVGVPETVFGPDLDAVALLGPDHCGRFERILHRLREILFPLAAEINSLLWLRDPAEQASRVAPGTRLGAALDGAFAEVMALPILVRLFSPEATQNAVEPYAVHFARRTRHALATLPAATNPYLWQVLAGRFPEGVSFPWLTAPTPGAAMPAVEWTPTTMADALLRLHGPFDLVHLSNIVDWQTEKGARDLLALTAHALRPGGLTIVRQLNSSLDIPSLGPAFAWERELSNQLHAADRSYFYRALHIGAKR